MSTQAQHGFPVHNYGEARRKYESAMRAKKTKKKGKKDQDERILRLADDSAPFNYVEAYKSLRTNLSFIASTDNINSIVITSAFQRESKSNTAINTCVSLASQGKRVILVDCDLRKPTAHTYLHLGRNAKGLTDVLSSSSKLGESIRYIEDLGFFVLPSGTIPPNPSEMLAQEKMKKVISKLKEAFDFVILDAPPISIVTDAAVLGKYVDGAVLVVRSKFASREAIKLAKKKLTDVDVKILGAVLTRFDAKASAKSGYYSYYGYGYDSYGYGYGQNNHKNDEQVSHTENNRPQVKPIQGFEPKLELKQSVSSDLKSAAPKTVKAETKAEKKVEFKSEPKIEPKPELPAEPKKKAPEQDDGQLKLDISSVAEAAPKQETKQEVKPVPETANSNTKPKSNNKKKSSKKKKK